MNLILSFFSNCLDETGGIVFDIGSHSTKVGFSGDGSPRSIFSSRVAVDQIPNGKPKYTAGPSSRLYKPNREILPFLDYGVINDWDAYESVIDYGAGQIHSTLQGRPVLMSEFQHTSSSQRRALTELMFEKHNVSGFYLAREPVLEAASAGKSTAVVIDMGASSTRVASIVDGFLVPRSLTMSPVGGDLISEVLYEELSAMAHPNDINPTYVCNKRRSTSDSTFEVVPVSFPVPPTRSFHRSSLLDLMDDAKHSLLDCLEADWSDVKPAPVKEAQYELPDGHVLTVKDLRRTIAELPFKAELGASAQFSRYVSGLAGTRTPSPGWIENEHARVKTSKGQSDVSSPLSIPSMVVSSLLVCTPEVRRDLSASVVLAGGASKTPGLAKRLVWELGHRPFASIPSAFKTNVLINPPHERMCAAWIGGAVLSSLGTFQQQWISKAEYSELGSRSVEVKCT
jgi:actin-related protein